MGLPKLILYHLKVGLHCSHLSSNVPNLLRDVM